MGLSTTGTRRRCLLTTDKGVFLYGACAHDVPRLPEACELGLVLLMPILFSARRFPYGGA